VQSFRAHPPGQGCVKVRVPVRAAPGLLLNPADLPMFATTTVRHPAGIPARERTRPGREATLPQPCPPGYPLLTGAASLSRMRSESISSTVPARPGTIAARRREEEAVMHQILVTVAAIAVASRG